VHEKQIVLMCIQLLNVVLQLPNSAIH